MEESSQSVWKIYPSKEPTRWSKGDKVRVKLLEQGNKYVCGEISEIDIEKVKISGNSGSWEIPTKEQSRLLFDDFDKDLAVLITSETSHFRQLARVYVTPNDSVLEIGFSSGETSKILVPICRSWVGFDTSQEMLAVCNDMLTTLSEFTSVHATIVDALVDPRKAREESTKFGNPNVIFLDIGGNRERVNVLRMISWVVDEFDPRLIVVKSRELVSYIRSSKDTSVDPRSGTIRDGSSWFRAHHQKRALPKHPLKAALVMSPIDKDIPICRYFNYHKAGCKRDGCKLDHTHCHACLKAGHIARACPIFSNEKQTTKANQLQEQQQ